ncbi:MAG: C4-type zinc ribbon domain-containing protein [Bacteroidales bacterium]
MTKKNTGSSSQQHDTSSKSENREVTIENKLIALYSLQKIDSKIDSIRLIRGELPLEVQDLEDEITGLKTRIENYKSEYEEIEKSIEERKLAIKASKELIKKYEEQQMSVRNNREYDSITKELEYQNLEIQLNEKKIKEMGEELEQKGKAIEAAREILQEREAALKEKKEELDSIVQETENEEKKLREMAGEHETLIEERILSAYKRIRNNARNGLAVVKIERGSCGGCFNKIPPQRQLDIKMHKKIIVCEYCGRILVDEGIEEMVYEREPFLKPSTNG